MWEAIGWLNTFLEGEKYVAGGDDVTIADIFIMSSMSSLVVLYDFSYYLKFKYLNDFFF